MDKPEAGIGPFAHAIREFYLTLTEGGVPEDVAYQLTRELLIQMFEGMFRSLLNKYGQD